MRQWIVKNFKDILIIVLLGILIIKNFGKPVNPQPVVVTKVDTVLILHDSTILSKPVIISKTLPVETQIPGNWMPKANYDSLKQQYLDSLKAYYALVVEKNTLQIDSIGTVSTLDSISHNEILARRWDYNIKERLITKTITYTNPPRRQVFYGGGINMAPLGSIESADVGVLYKNRKNNVLQLSIGYNIPRSIPQYGIHYYLPIKLHK